MLVVVFGLANGGKGQYTPKALSSTEKQRSAVCDAGHSQAHALTAMSAASRVGLAVLELVEIIVVA